MADIILHSGQFTTQDDKLVNVTFYKRDDGESTMTVVPYSIRYMASGGTYGITVTFTGVEPEATLEYVQGDPGWLMQHGDGTVTDNIKEWAWTASANSTGSTRSAKVTVRNGKDTVVVGITQGSS